MADKEADMLAWRNFYMAVRQMDHDVDSGKVDPKIAMVEMGAKWFPVPAPEKKEGKK